MTSWDDQRALVDAALERFGRLDAYFANAGFGGARSFLGDSVEHWKAMIDTNVYGVALSIRASLGHFKQQNRGHIVLTGSTAGRRNITARTCARRWPRRTSRSRWSSPA